MASLGLNELKKMGSLRHPQWYYLNKIKEPAHMVENNSRRDLPILSYYKPSQYNTLVSGNLLAEGTYIVISKTKDETSSLRFFAIHFRSI